eukprot:GFYU01041570.1.p2 GENE.GFYU01041570.1~~GFYU01041570.1.p2  ORF type:complete len:123 (-),score=2.65 GFYU01041570.1:1002-1370(-)
MKFSLCGRSFFFLLLYFLEFFFCAYLGRCSEYSSVDVDVSLFAVRGGGGRGIDSHAACGRVSATKDVGVVSRVVRCGADRGRDAAEESIIIIIPASRAPTSTNNKYNVLLIISIPIIFSGSG